VFSHDTFTALFGAARPGELEALPGLIRAALRAGYAIVLNEPGTKKPVCTLTAAARKKADRVAQDEALERGEPRAAMVRHACGVAHALTEDDALKVTALVSRLTEAYGAVPNIGVEPGASVRNLLVVDVDTAAENQAFLDAWRREQPEVSPPSGFTVASPGVRKTTTDAAGETHDVWVHRDGGHYWFTVPDDVTLPAGVGLLKDEAGWGAAWAGRQVLVPPSVREEGPYRYVGGTYPAPAWLLDRVFLAAQARVERERIRAERWQARQRGELDIDPVDAWSAATPWAELLEPDGWVATGLVDTCSCPTWTAPGGHASPKSATAHDEGCTRYDSEDGHAPLHVWTDNPPDYLADACAHSRTINRLTYVAYRDHHEPGGSKHEAESAAVSALGLALSVDGPMLVDDPFDLGAEGIQNQSSSGPDEEGNEQVTNESHAKDDGESPGDPTLNGSAASTVDRPGETAADPFESVGTVTAARAEQPSGKGSTEDTGEEGGEEPDAPPAEKPSRKPGGLSVYDSSELDELPDPDPLIFGLLDRGSVAILSGKFGTYKSFLALDWACHVALGRAWEGHPVDQAVPAVYIAAEGQVGVKRRVRGWRKRHLAGEHLPHGALTVIPQRVVLETDKDGKATAHLRELVELVNERGAGLVVFDTLSKSKGKAEENSNSDMSALMALVIELTRATKATVLLVAHTGYSGEHTRGGSSQEDDVDTVFVIKFEDAKSEDRGLDVRRVLHHRKAKDGDLSQPRVLVPRVEELGQDSHGRPVTTLTLTTDPWEVSTTATRREKGSEEEVLTWLREIDAPADLGQKAAWDWMRGHEDYADHEASGKALWDAYKRYKAGYSTRSESLDSGMGPDQEE
jgi:hypothetical protein